MNSGAWVAINRKSAKGRDRKLFQFVIRSNPKTAFRFFKENPGVNGNRGQRSIYCVLSIWSKKSEIVPLGRDSLLKKAGAGNYFR